MLESSSGESCRDAVCGGATARPVPLGPSRSPPHPLLYISSSRDTRHLEVLVSVTRRLHLHS